MVATVQELTSYLIDLDGVIYRGDMLIPGAKAFINWLEENHKKYLFVTNNSFASGAQVVAKLARLGIPVTEEHVMGAGQAAVKNIAHRFPGASVYIVGEPPLFDLARAENLRIANDDWQSADVVFVGLDRAFDYKKLNEAVQALKKGAKFIAVNRDPLLPVAGGLIAGCGTMVAAIEAGSEVKPEVVGKPQPTLLEEAMRQLGSKPEETVMIGDNIGIDLKAGVLAGTQTMLVFSGKDTPEALAKTDVRVDYVYEHLAALMEEIQRQG